MTRIGLISDTHSYLDETVFTHFQHCDEVWHAGDWGDPVLKEKLAADGELVAVAGMVKRAAGYDSRAGDWEYFYAERGGTLSRGAIEPCVSCHARAKATDYVFTTIGSKG